MIGGLDHINIETTDLAASVQFYQDLLGLTSGWRPPFDADGAWLYAGEVPIVHLVVRDKVNSGATGAINHVALQASGLAEVKSRLQERKVSFKEIQVPDTQVIQLFLHDPNGVRLELSFDEGGDG